MATVAGVLHLQSGQPAANVGLRFILLTAPVDAAGTVVTGRPILTETDALGVYSQALVPGDYCVDIPATDPFQITVPPGTGSFPLEELDSEGGTEPPPPPVGTYPVFIPTIAEARSEVIPAGTIEVDLGMDDNGDAGTFKRDPLYDTTLRTDGVDYFRDSSGAIFKRLRFL